MTSPTTATHSLERSSRPEAPRPPVPETLADTGLSPETVTDLLLKTLYVQGVQSGQQLTDAVRLPFPLIDELLLVLQQQRLVEVRRTTGAGRGGYVFDLGDAGRDRAREALATSRYVGPAPVPLEQYRTWIDRQSIRHVHVDRERLEQAFSSRLVLAPEMYDILGPAVNSAKSLFLFGHPGNGKTMMAEIIAQLLGGAFYVPYAVDVDGEIMVVYDPVHHRPAAEPEEAEVGPDGGPPWLRAVPEYDRRFSRVKRPVVVAGGELTLNQLELQYDTYAKMYQAPFQVKANGGVLILDDFGRQRVPPRDLLNRWIVPLEKRIDFLTLHTGSKFPVPFDCLLIFGTNLKPEDLVEEAFLRRIHYKLHVPSPTRVQFEQIFERCCVERGITYDPGAVDYIYRQFYQPFAIAPRGCHPRDIVDHVCDVARFMRSQPTLSAGLIDRACHAYFIEIDSSDPT